MDGLGKILRETRIQKGIDYEEVIAAIKIQEKHIKALESDDRGAFVAEIYYKAFLKAYAEFLGLNTNEILKKYDEMKKEAGVKTPGQDGGAANGDDDKYYYKDNKFFFVKERVANALSNDQNSKKYFILAIILALLVIGGIGYLIFNHLKTPKLIDETIGNEDALVESYDTETVLKTQDVPVSNQPPVVEQAQSPQSYQSLPPNANPIPAPVAANAPATPAIQIAQPQSAAPQTQQQTAQAIHIPAPMSAPSAGGTNFQAQGQTAAPAGQTTSQGAGTEVLSVTALDNVWVRIDTDGSLAYEGIMQSGSTRVLRGREGFRIRVGYARGIRVTYNGRPVDTTAGAKNDVNTIVLRRN
jgi:cytoskeleton protein RodZ